MAFEVGIFTFGEVTADLATRMIPSPQQRMRDTLEQAVLAEQAGLDVFGVGEHHRSDFIASAPPVILAAVAAVTERIRLTSAVTVLSSADPVRVFQEFATLDLISGGRAEILAGRGSYSESFPLFGDALEDYADLYSEKLNLLMQIRDRNPISWTGRFRSDLVEADIAPRPVQDLLPIWVALGGSPASAVRAGTLGLPLALAILFSPIDYHQRNVTLYRQAAVKAGHDPATMPVSVSAHGFVAATSQHARDVMFPYFSTGMNENNHQRGKPFNLPRRAFDAMASPAGGLLVGSPQEVIDKILAYDDLYGLSRVNLQMGFGGVPQADHLKAIELLGTEVVPVVRRDIASRTRATAA